MWTSAPAPSMTGPTSASRRCRASCSARAVFLVQRIQQRLDTCPPIRALVILRQDAEPLDAVEHDVRSPVFELLGVRDESGAPDLVDGGFALVCRLVAGLQQDHPDQPVAIQRGREHLPVPRLEDLQRQAHVREQDDVGKGKRGRSTGSIEVTAASCRMTDDRMLARSIGCGRMCGDASHCSIRHPHPASVHPHVSERSASSCPRNPSARTAPACAAS